jgi:hypothetical protein
MNNKTRPPTVIIVIGLLAILIGVLGISVTFYQYFKPYSHIRTADFPLVTLADTIWGVIINGALVIAGIAIYRLKNWGRILAIIYAIFSSVEYLINLNSAFIPPHVQQPPTTFIVSVVPLVVWIALIIVLTRTSIVKFFYTREETKTSEQQDSIQGISWGDFGLRFLGTSTLYVAASHVFFPYPTPMNIFSPLKILVYYLLGYLTMFVSVYLLISLPTVVVAKIIPKYRNTQVPRLLTRTLVPAFVVGGILIYGGWYGSKMAGISP